MEPQFSEEQLKSLAAQLRCPDGEMGIETGRNMNNGNQTMIAETLKLLELKADAAVLELGPGNAQHLASLLDQYEIRSYHGLEISQTMCDQAITLNKDIDHTAIRFSCYDGLLLPFEPAIFDCIFTVNTIYFWEDPQAFLSEIARVLKPGGKLFIAFAQASFMEQLPFVQYGFTLYDTAKISALAAKSHLKIETEWDKNDIAISKTGTKVAREFTILKLSHSGF